MRPLFIQSKKILFLLILSVMHTAQGQSSQQIDGWMHAHGENSNYPYYEAPNGCSNTPDKYANIVSFHGACDNHDICYMSLGTTKEECDIKFFDDLHYACKHYLDGLWNALLPGCYADIIAYETGVFTLGGKAWATSQSAQNNYLRTINSHLTEIKNYIPTPPAPLPDDTMDGCHPKFGCGNVSY